jgi:DNA-binding transcriptional MocR family regulator
MVTSGPHPSLTFGSPTTSRAESHQVSWRLAQDFGPSVIWPSIYEVSYGTIRHAMKVLRERGLIRTVHGRGTYISDSYATERFSGPSTANTPCRRHHGAQVGPDARPC